MFVLVSITDSDKYLPIRVFINMTNHSLPKHQNTHNSRYLYYNRQNQAAITALIQKFHHFSFGLAHSLSVIIDSTFQILLINS